MTPAEIIARAYDREQAAQMGEPDPWQDNTDDPQWQDSLGCAEAAVDAIEAAGYRIIGPGELDRDTLEKAAQCVERDEFDAGIRLDPKRHANLSDWFREQRAAAIRALAEDRSNE